MAENELLSGGERVVPLLMVLILGGLLAMAGYLALVFQRRREEFERQAQQQETEFEAEVLSQLATLAPPAAAPAPSSFQAGQAVLDEPPPMPSATGEKPSVELIARQLVGLRIATELQGRIPLPIPPDGLIYGLRRGGACAILPRQEGPELMEHLSRRFDMVFFPAPSGEVHVIERLQARLPSLIELPGANRPN